MSLRFEVEHRDGYSVVRVEGAPSLGQFLSFLHLIGVETAGWEVGRVLFDLRGVETLSAATELRAVREESARRLAHLQRSALLLDAQRVTHTAEETAPGAAMNLGVFTDEARAVAWISA